VLTSLDEVLQ